MRMPGFGRTSKHRSAAIPKKAARVGATTCDPTSFNHYPFPTYSLLHKSVLEASSQAWLALMMSRFVRMAGVRSHMGVMEAVEAWSGAMLEVISFV